MIWSASAKAMADESETKSYYLTGDRIDQWLAKQTGDGGTSTLNWYQADRLGSITGITDETGTTIVSTTYSAFGVIQDQTFIDEQKGTVLNGINLRKGGRGRWVSGKVGRSAVSGRSLVRRLIPAPPPDGRTTWVIPGGRGTCLPTSLKMVLS